MLFENQSNKAFPWPIDADQLHGRQGRPGYPPSRARGKRTMRTAAVRAGPAHYSASHIEKILSAMRENASLSSLVK
jgi:hypothetical protein